MKVFLRHDVRAFTLIEVLVALAIFGLVVTAIYSSWTAILRGAKVGQEAAAAVQRSRIAIRTLEDSLTAARSFNENISYYSFIAENGSEASLSFVARLPKQFPRSGRFGDFDVRRLTFSVESGPDSSRQLVLRQNPILMEWDIDEENHPIVLARDVEEFEIGFWDTRIGDWVDEWTQTNQLPKMVKVTLVLNRGQNAQVQEVATRVVALPAIGVQSGWQRPALPSRPGPGPPAPPPPPK
jgi:type II secretion system protein J